MEFKIKDVLIALLLISLLWILNIFFAFQIFSPIRADTSIILLSWIISNGIIITILTKRKIVDKNTFFGALIVFGALVVLYLIPINNNIPSEAISLNEQISRNNVDRLDYAEELFEIVDAKYKIGIRDYLIFPNRVFLLKDFKKAWNLPEGSYLDSGRQVEIYRKLLLQSERFSEEEVKIIEGFCINSPHPFVEFNVSNKIFYGDFFASDSLGAEFGDKTVFPCDEIIRGDQR